MATAQRITVDNYDTLLVQSSQGRSGTPDGNIFFDVTNGVLEIITADQLAQIDLGSGAEANPLTADLGIELRALYAFERQERRTDENLREVLPFFDGSFKFSGAYELANGRGLASADYPKIRGSGLIKRAANNAVDRIYIGVRSLNDIESTSQPFYQLAASTSESDRQSAAPVDFSRTGPVDEMVQVFGSTANGDSTAGSFDSTNAILIASVRTFGRGFSATTSTASGIAELNGFSAGFGFGDGDPTTTNTYNLADVFGGSQISPWTGMGLERFASPQTKTGFVSGSADFTDVVTNTASGSLNEIRAFLDALMLQDTDQDDGTGSFIPKRAEPLYTINTDGVLVTRQGLFIDNLSTADRQLVILTDDSGTAQTYPFDVDVRVTVDTFWVNDSNGWYHCFISDGAGSDDFNTANAVTLNDASGNPVKGTSTDVISGEIRFSYAYDSNTQAGLSAATDRVVVFLAEGDGGAAAGLATFTITRDSIVRASVVSGQETNI